MLSDLLQRVRLFLLMTVAAFFLSACMSSAPGRIRPYPADMGAASITSEIDRLEKSLADPAAGKAEEPAFHLRLAMLYTHPDNPAPDLARAAQHLEAYTGAGGSVDSQYALMLLRTLEEKQAAIAQLTDDKRTLQEKYDRLEQESREKTGIIEKLQSLDLKLEKKRKQIRRR